MLGVAEFLPKSGAGAGSGIENLPGLPVAIDFSRVFGNHIAPRISDEELVKRTNSSRLRLGWKQVKREEFPGARFVICGGGWSLKDSVEDIKRLQAAGALVIAVNRTHDYLVELGIVPWAGALLDPMPHTARYITPHPGVRYYIGSQVHSDTLDVFDAAGSERYLWHVLTTNTLKTVLWPEEMKVATASQCSTVGLCAFFLTSQLGGLSFDLVGFDSSYHPSQIKDGKLIEGGTLHAYPKPETVHDLQMLGVVDLLGNETNYWSNPNMEKQYEEFKKIPRYLMAARAQGMTKELAVYVHGYGMLPDTAAGFGWHFSEEKNRTCMTAMRDRMNELLDGRPSVEMAAI